MKFLRTENLPEIASKVEKIHPWVLQFTYKYIFHKFLGMREYASRPILCFSKLELRQLFSDYQDLFQFQYVYLHTWVKFLLYNSHRYIFQLSCCQVLWLGGISSYSTPANIYLFKVNNSNSRNRCEIYSNLLTKTPERRPQNGPTNVNFPANAVKFIASVVPFCGRRLVVFIDTFEHISHLFLLLAFSMVFVSWNWSCINTWIV